MNAPPLHLAAGQLPPLHVTIQGDVHVHIHLADKDEVLSPLESTILQALGDETLGAEDLAARAGYPNTSYFRTVLAGLRRRGLIINLHPGYRRAGDGGGG
jgi:hypothetical protein